MSSSSHSSASDSCVTQKPSSLPRLKKSVATKEKEKEKEKEGSCSKPSSSRKRPAGDQHKASQKPSSSKKLMKSAENLSPGAGEFLMTEKMIKEGLEMYNAQLLIIFDWFMNKVYARAENIVNAAKVSIADISDGEKLERGVSGFDLSYARKSSSLSKEDAETLAQKWKAQWFTEMETAKNRAELMLEEYRLVLRSHQ